MRPHATVSCTGPFKEAHAGAGERRAPGYRLTNDRIEGNACLTSRSSRYVRASASKPRRRHRGTDVGHRFAELERAFYAGQVLVLRGQKLTPAQFVAFARRFGPPEPHVIDQFHHPDDPNILILSNVKKDGKPTGLQDAGSYFHTDYSYLQVPARATTLYSIVVPKVGGDTLFANQQAAYDDLPEAMKKRIEPLYGIHHYGNRHDTDERSRTAASPLTDEQKAKMPLITHQTRAAASGDRQDVAVRGQPQLVRHRRHAGRRSARPAGRARGAFDAAEV